MNFEILKIEYINKLASYIIVLDIIGMEVLQWRQLELVVICKKKTTANYEWLIGTCFLLVLLVVCQLFVSGYLCMVDFDVVMHYMEMIHLKLFS